MKENSNDIKYIINKDSHFLRNLGIVLLSFTFGIVGGILGDRLCYEYDKSDNIISFTFWSLSLFSLYLL